MSNVVHPRHYNLHPTGIECLDVVERMSFCLGNAVKYLWRADHKGKTGEDIAKAVFYIERWLESRFVGTVPTGAPILQRYAARIAEHPEGYNHAIVDLIHSELTRNPMYASRALHMLQTHRHHPGDSNGPPRQKLRS